MQYTVHFDHKLLDMDRRIYCVCKLDFVDNQYLKYIQGDNQRKGHLDILLDICKYHHYIGYLVHILLTRKDLWYWVLLQMHNNVLFTLNLI